MSDVTGVKHVTAVASDSSAKLTSEFALETDTDRALNDIKDAVTGVRGDLPEAVTEPLIKRLDVTGAAILTYAVTDPTRTIEELSYFVDDVVARDLHSVKGVGQVLRLGGADREIKVELEPDRLLALGLSASEVNSQLRAKNIDLGGGRGNLSGQEFSIRALGSADTVEQLAATAITLPTGRTVRLDQLGAVRDGPAEARAFAMVNGQPVVSFGVFRATGASDLEAANNAKQKLEEINKAYPNTEFTKVDDATLYTEGNYHSAMETLYEGAILAVIVVFLKNWRATLITAVALPLSIIATFFVMSYLGFSLNTVSLLGITLVTGILVDDAIVEIENIVRHIHMGKPAFQASEEAATEIGTTVIAISATIVAVFAPVSFMGGIAGQYFKQFGLTVAVAVLFSLLVARLVTPMMSAYFLTDANGHEAPKDGVIMRGYMRILRWTLRHRLVTLLGGLAIFAVSIYSATLLPTEFVPETDNGRATLSLELPPGSTLDDTRAVARDLSDRLGTIPEVRTVYVDGGSGSITKANLIVNYGQKSDRDRTSFAIKDDIAAMLPDLPDVRVHLIKDNGQRDVEIAVLGETERAASLAAVTLADEMNGLATIRNASSSAALTRPEIQITPKTELASEMGVVADIALSTGPSTIERYDRKYRTTVQADLAPDALLGPATVQINALPAARNMPEGTSIQNAGDAEVMGEVFTSFGLAMGAGILLVYVVLVLLFSSFVTPVTILMSLPLAIGGAIFALYSQNYVIGVSVVIGFLMLMGIVTKNAIMLVEFAITAMASGVGKTEAMLDAGHKRARPIMMTTIAMTAGMLPSALAFGTGGEFRAPMAVAVIGGLLLSTLLSLIFVPTVFSLMEGLKWRISKWFVAVLGANQPTAGQASSGD